MNKARFTNPGTSKPCRGQLVRRSQNRLSEWTAAACAELRIAESDIDRAPILQLAQNSARVVARPAAPITTYLLGLAIGRGEQPDEAIKRLRDLAARWQGIDWRD